MADIEHWFGQNVRRRRAELGMSQAGLAVEMTRYGHKMHQVTVGKIETAKRPTSIGELFALAGILNVNPNQLLEPADPCEHCRNNPPPGYQCNACGRSS